MPNLEIPNNNIIVDKIFTDYMKYASESSLTNIENFMKNNLNNIKLYNSDSYNKILQLYNTYNYWGKLEPEKNIYELIENRANALKQHHSDLFWLYNKLCDYRSKKTLFGIIDNWLTFNMLSLSKIIDKTFLHYFDLDIIKCDENEVFVDLGAYTGDTVKDYLNSYIGYKKIYCYEIMPNLFQTLKRNLKQYPNIVFRQKGVSDKNDIMYVTDEEADLSMHKLSDTGKQTVPAVKLDDDIKEAVTFIKMDIEGGEQNAILGCKSHIKSAHPKLAISVYHNNEDIWKCARMINEIDPNYKFYLRYNGGNYYPSEYVLLCV